MRKLTPLWPRTMRFRNHIGAKPFPGKWPTRILIELVEVPEERPFFFSPPIVVYLGKPSHKQIQRAVKLLKPYGKNYLKILEFDKEQPVWHGVIQINRADTPENQLDRQGDVARRTPRMQVLHGKITRWNNHMLMRYWPNRPPIFDLKSWTRVTAGPKIVFYT